jgi:hypothetical protein
VELQKMFELVTLVQIAVAAALVAAPAIAIVRAIDGSGIAEPMATSSVASWPRGVQEEEPRTWQLPSTPAPAGATA